MTKQELIKEAYGKHWDFLNKYITSNGWCNYWPVKIAICDVKGQYWRPKAIKGLEKNNGWIKIENENDLPTIGEYYTIANFDNLIVEREFPNPKFSLEFNKEWWLKYITHYQQIIKPEKPLY